MIYRNGQPTVLGYTLAFVLAAIIGALMAMISQ